MSSASFNVLDYGATPFDPAYQRRNLLVEEEVVLMPPPKRSLQSRLGQYRRTLRELRLVLDRALSPHDGRLATARRA
jgi:hypothetical protein